MPKKKTSLDKAKTQFIVWRDISTLQLDPLNPRIIVPPNASQNDILRVLYETEALDELVLSLAMNGYFPEEPVVVVPHAKFADKFVVVEGNRRLAALKILLEPIIRKKLGAIDLPTLSPTESTQLQEIPTVLYQTRDEVVPYLGFRHITGIKTWDPFAKARYISELINSGRPISEVEETIGDSSRTVKKLYQSYLVYQQIISDIGLDGSLVRRNFSLLEVTLSQQPIKKLLGIPRSLPAEKTDTIVSDTKLEALREVVSWIFGDSEKGQDRIITDSRQIPRFLAPVVADSDALEHLRNTRDLEGAYEYSGGEVQYLIKQLQNARRALQRALGVLPLHKEDAEVNAEIERLEKLFSAIRPESKK